MKLLTIDTATLTASVGVWVDDQLLVEKRRRVTTHSEALLATIDEVLREAGLEPAALDGVACGAGPGSFTGLRIGLATAKGLCFALGKPLVMVSSLEAIAARAPDRKRVCAALDAHKDEVYAGVWDVNEGALSTVMEPRVLAPSALQRALEPLGPITLVGDALHRYADVLLVGDIAPLAADDDGAPHAAELARLAAARLRAGAHDDLRSAPSYLRASEAELARDKARQNQ